MGLLSTASKTIRGYYSPTSGDSFNSKIYRNDNNDDFITSFKIENIKLEPEISLPLVEAFELSNIIEDHLSFEYDELIKSLMIFSKNYRVDLSDLITRILNYETQEVIPNIEETDDRVQMLYARMKLLDGMVKKNTSATVKYENTETFDDDLDEIVGLSVNVSDQIKKLLGQVKRLEDKVLTYDQEKLSDKESVNKFQYPLLSKLMVKHFDDDIDNNEENNSNDEDDEGDIKEECLSDGSLTSSKALDSQEALPNLADSASTHLIDISEDYSYFKSPLDRNQVGSDKAESDTNEEQLKGFLLLNSLNKLDLENENEFPNLIDDLNYDDNDNNVHAFARFNSVKLSSDELSKTFDNVQERKTLDQLENEDMMEELISMKSTAKIEEPGIHNNKTINTSQSFDSKTEKSILSPSFEPMVLSPQEQLEEIEDLLDKRARDKQNKSKGTDNKKITDSIFNDEENSEFEEIRKNNPFLSSSSQSVKEEEIDSSPPKLESASLLTEFYNVSTPNVNHSLNPMLNFGSPQSSRIGQSTIITTTVPKMASINISTSSVMAKPFITTDSIHPEQVLEKIQKDDDKKRSMSINDDNTAIGTLKGLFKPNQGNNENNDSKITKI